MNAKNDTLLVIGFAGLLGSVSLVSFGKTDIGTPLTGWMDGQYQRNYEQRFEASLPSKSLSSDLWAAAKWWLLDEPAQGAIVGKNGWLFTEEELLAPQTSHDFFTEISAFKNTLNGHGIRLIPVVVPDKIRMQSQHLPRGRSAPFERRYDTAMQDLTLLDLPAIDLRPALDFDGSYMRTDTHWSPAGARSVAQTIATYLSKSPFEHSKVGTEKTGEMPFSGDLMAFVDIGNFRNNFSMIQETIPSFSTTVQTSGGLFGDSHPPFTLVGTSYSARPEFHFGGFLQTALQADLINLSTSGRGPYFPMTEFLRELPEQSVLPNIVIWEIPERYITLRSI